MASVLKRSSVWVKLDSDITAVNVAPYRIPGVDGGQAQVSFGEDFVLGITGTPDEWRHLAKVIEDAAMDLEGQIAEHWARLDDPADIGAGR
jgi:hypothetical protein